MSDGAPVLQVLSGRYVIGEAIGRGGAATVHLGKSIDKARRGVVAIKRLHPHLSADPAFVAMMLDEARLLSRVRHANVVSTLDVVMEGGELYLVMEYVHGATLGALLSRAHRERVEMPIPVACAIVRGALLGLHAAHEATSATGEALGVVHRDVSPQNLIIAESGEVKVVDFGIAKAEGRVLHTQDGSIKGKLGYMPPEQLFGELLDRRADIYAAGVVLWECVTGERLFAGEDGGPALVKSLVSHVAAPSDRREGVPEGIDRAVLRALAHDRELRFSTGQEMADALSASSLVAAPADVAGWVRTLAADALDERGARLFVFDETSRSMIRDLVRAREAMPSIVLGVPGGAAGAGAAGAGADGAGADGAGAGGAGAGGAGVEEGSSRRRRWLLGAAAAMCAAAGGALAFFVSDPVDMGATSGAESASSVDPAPSAESGRAAGAGGAARGAASEPSPPAGDDPAGAATASDATGATASPPTSTEPPAKPSPSTGGTPAKTATAARTAVTTQKPASPPAGCDPPFTIDAQGHKRYKRECLR
ncbi:MAG: serine/threonine-protein kinase [Polyangiaceae bacterium]